MWTGPRLAPAAAMLAGAGGIALLIIAPSRADPAGLTPDRIRIVDVRRDSAAGRMPERVPADGVFYVVTVTLPADTPFVATIEDGSGMSWSRARDVESLLGGAHPTGDPGVRRLVFDVPGNIRSPRLVLRPPGRMARLLGPRVERPLAPAG